MEESEGEEASIPGEERIWGPVPEAQAAAEAPIAPAKL